MRLWFGGLALDSANHITDEGFDGVMQLQPLPGALVLLGAGLVRLAAYGRRKKAVI